MSEDDAAGFLNPRGYRLDKVDDAPYLWIWRKAIYEYQADRLKPLTFVMPSGVSVRPDSHFKTDMGSIPALIQLFPNMSKDRFLLSFIFHDSCYAHGGLWVLTIAGWEFKRFTRAEADSLLALMIKHEPCPGGVVVSRSVWLGVRIGGWVSWGKGDIRKKMDPDSPMPTLKTA